MWAKAKNKLIQKEKEASKTSLEEIQKLIDKSIAASRSNIEEYLKLKVSELTPMVDKAVEGCKEMNE